MFVLDWYGTDGHLGFICTQRPGVGVLSSFHTHARWVARNAKRSILTILRKSRGL